MRTNPLRTAYRLKTPKYCVPKGGCHRHMGEIVKLDDNVTCNGVWDHLHDGVNPMSEQPQVRVETISGKCCVHVV